MKLNKLKKNLKELSKEDLIKDIADLFKKNSFVKDYYELKYGDESSLSVLIKHKKIIENEFFPKKGLGKARLMVSKKSITEFVKLSNDKYQIAELMVFYVENGVSYTTTYGDIDEQFYYSMNTMFEKAVKYIYEHDLEEPFKERCSTIVNDSSNTGWGFYEHLFETYFDYFED